jgi:hypothetical protein
MLLLLLLLSGAWPCQPAADQRLAPPLLPLPPRPAAPPHLAAAPRLVAAHHPATAHHPAASPWGTALQPQDVPADLSLVMDLSVT